MRYSEVVRLSRTGGERFSAFQARHHSFEGLMSPVLGFDHFRLTADVFGPHRHAGMSAISYVFEDSVPYHNQDSMGTDLVITPGSLLWTWAGSGVVHHEVPTTQGEVHGLQLFLDIAPGNRALPPRSVYIPREKMVASSNDGVDVKVVMGMGVEVSTPEPVSLLDIRLGGGKAYSYLLREGWNGTVYVLEGSVEVGAAGAGVGGEGSSGTVGVSAAGATVVGENEAIAFGAGSVDETVRLTAVGDSRLLLISGPPVGGQ